MEEILLKCMNLLTSMEFRRNPVKIMFQKILHKWSVLIFNNAKTVGLPLMISLPSVFLLKISLNGMHMNMERFQVSIR